MTDSRAFYAEEDDGLGFFKVTFLIRETGVKLVRSFDSAYLADQFVKKCKRSKKVQLISYPLYY